MVTAQAALTPAADPTPAIVNAAPGELSGATWTNRFPTSAAVSDCAAPFKANLMSFIAALGAAGATVQISATLRPKERAFLMHWCWKIVNAGADPQAIPTLPGVDINWAHTDAHGTYSVASSKEAAQQMVNAYQMQNLQVAPALNSKHIAGLAVDMSITWSGTLTINNATSTAVVISTDPKTGMNTDLHAVGASFGVIKFVGGDTDKPHWSDTGN